MNIPPQDEVAVVTAAAERLHNRLSRIAPQAKPLVADLRTALANIRQVLAPVLQDSRGGYVSEKAGKTLALNQAIVDRIIDMNSELDRLATTWKAAMSDVALVAYHLSILSPGEVRESRSTAASAANYGALVGISLSEWKFLASLAPLHLYGLIQAHHAVSCAYLGFKPGSRFDVKGAAQEVEKKLKDTFQDFLVFPGYALIRKVVKKLKTSAVDKYADAIVQAAGDVERLDQWSQASIELAATCQSVFQTIQACLQQLDASHGSFVEESLLFYAEVVSTSSPEDEA